MPTWPYATNTAIILTAAILESGTGAGAVGNAPQDGKKTFIGKWSTTEKTVYEQGHVEWPDTGAHRKGHSDQSCQYFPARGTAYGLICYHWGNLPFGTRAEQWTSHVGRTKVIVGLSEIYIPGQLQLDLWVSMMDERFGSWGVIPAKSFSDPITITIMGAFDLSVPATQIRYSVFSNAIDAQQRSWVESISFHHSIVAACNYEIGKFVECWMANGGMPSDVPNLTGHYHVIHDIKVKSELYPADGTLVPVGASVQAHAIAEASCTLSLFTVDGVDKLASNPFTTPPATADIHLAAVAGYGSITKRAGETISETITLSVCANCGPVTWTADFGTLTGLTIGAATGIISGTIPYLTPPGTYPITVTATNNGRATSRTFNLIITDPTVYGSAWVAFANLGVAADAYVASLCQTSTGRLLVGIGGTASCTILKCDDPDAVAPTFTDVDPTAAVFHNGTPGNKSNLSVRSIRELASGVLIAVANNNTSNDPIVFTSADDGDTWVCTVNSGAGAAPVDVYDVVEIAAGVVSYCWGTTKVVTAKSADDGATWAAGYQFTTGATHGRRLLAVGDGNAVMSATSVAAGSNILLYDGTTGSSKLAIAVNNAVCGQMAKNDDGTILVPVQTKLYSGGTDGAAFAEAYTAAANIGTLSNVYSGVMVMGLNGTIAVLRSTDKGATWSATTGTPDGDQCFCSLMLTSGAILLGTNGAANNLWRSGP